MNKFQTKDLTNKRFLITGGAGFIGSHLVDYLIKNGAFVRVLDNFSNGYYENIKQHESNPMFEFIKGDIRDFDTCEKAVQDIQYVSHQAALGSVPRSIENPVQTNDVNIGGFVNMITVAKNSPSVQRFIYAASSSTYGDSELFQKLKEMKGVLCRHMQ